MLLFSSDDRATYIEYRGKGVKSSHRERGSTVLGECSKTQIEQDTE